MRPRFQKAHFRNRRELSRHFRRAVDHPAPRLSSLIFQATAGWRFGGGDDHKAARMEASSAVPSPPRPSGRPLGVDRRMFAGHPRISAFQRRWQPVRRSSPAGRKIRARRLIAGYAGGDQKRVPAGTEEEHGTPAHSEGAQFRFFFRPLRGSNGIGGRVPAINRWAFFGRPCGTTVHLFICG